MTNGNGWTWKVLTVIMIPAFFMLVSAVIANDKDARERDTTITEKLSLSSQEQNKVNQQILVTLAEIKSDIKYMRGRKDEQYKPL